MNEEPKFMVDTEYCGLSSRLKDAKVLVVGKDHVDTESLLKAIKEHPDVRTIVVDSSVEEPKLDVKKAMANAALSAFMGPALEFMERKYRKRPKDMVKCGLPGCGRMSVKDYCSAEHCREHRERQRATRKGGA